MYSRVEFDKNYARIHIIRYISAQIANFLSPPIIDDINSMLEHFCKKMKSELKSIKPEIIRQDISPVAPSTSESPLWIRTFLKLYNDHRVIPRTKMFEEEDIKSIKNLENILIKLKSGDHTKCLKILSLYLPKSFFFEKEERSTSEIDLQAAYLFKKLCKHEATNKKNNVENYTRINDTFAEKLLRVRSKESHCSLTYLMPIETFKECLTEILEVLKL